MNSIPYVSLSFLRCPRGLSRVRPVSLRLLPGLLPVCLLICLSAGLSLVLSGCTEKGTQKKARVARVEVIRLEARDVPLTVELPGRVSAFRTAEVRPQVGGILQKQLFTEGSSVTEGQSLYKIEPATYAADVRSAQAELGRAEASLMQARLRRERRRGLLGSHAVSKQAVEDADAEYLQAGADVEVARARLVTAEIRLRYTDVLAPITGRIGKSRMTQGALVTANQAEPLAVIHQIDPVYVDMTRSSHELLNIRNRLARGEIRKDRDATPVRLLLEDSTVYSQEGRLQFADISVDMSTGMVLMRAVFPNPHETLLPGLYVRAVVEEGIAEHVLCIPERAIQRNARGEASVFLVREGRAVRRVIETRERVGRERIVTGVDEGDLVVTEGMRQLKDGDPVEIGTAAGSREG